MRARFKVLVTDFITDSLEPERRILGEMADVDAAAARDERELHGQIELADALMVYHTLSLSQQTVERLAQCKLIVRWGVGYENVHVESARKMGIPVVNIPDYGTEDVADSAVGLMLALTRGISLMNTRLRIGPSHWTYTEAAPLQRLRGQVFGIVGLGRIGTAAALRAKAFGMDVCFYDPYKPDGYDKALRVRRVEAFNDLLERAFVLSLHCPLTSETHHMINASRIAKMPRGSYLVNTARGAIVDTKVIPDAIQSGQLAGAAFDVLEEEPPTDDSCLFRAWRNPSHPASFRVIINPHSAFYSEEGLMELRTKAAEACRRALLGERLQNVVNLAPPSNI